MIAALTALIVALLVIAAMRPLAPAVGLIDQPGGRKTHHGEVPLVGGIGMFVALVAGAGMMPVTDRDALPLLGACALLLAVGLADDRFDIPVWARLTAHLAAALLALAMLDRGMTLTLGHAFGPGETLLTGAAALMLTALLVGGAINAFNMVDGMDGLAALVDRLVEAGKRIRVVFPVHPRTKGNLEKAKLLSKLEAAQGIRVLEPLGYLDFLCLMEGARVVLTDSGGIQEETTVLGVPCLTLRDNTERPITVEQGTNQLVGAKGEGLLDALEQVLGRPLPTGRRPALWDGRAAQRIMAALLDRSTPGKRVG